MGRPHTEHRTLVSPAKRRRLFPLMAALLVVLSAAGCAVHHYRAAPISPEETAARMEASGLADPGLRAYMEQNLGHSVSPWPPASWTLPTLTLAALYFHPDMEASRARVAEAEAAERTAGARPNPTLIVAPGVPSPYLFHLDFDVPLETAGKRGHRIESARSLSLAARLELGEAAWKLRSQLRQALVNRLLAARVLQALHMEEELRRAQVRMLEQRLEAGEIARPLVDTARIELARTHLAVVAAEGRVAETTAALAAAIAVPASALEGIQFSWPELASPPDAASLPAASIRREAVVNRLDVRRALALYAAREAQLQLEIAKQYPDVHIAPGYAYEEGKGYFTLGVAATLPVFNRNQGPIAEAEARRKQAGAAVLQTQALVLAESETALARYTGALEELAETDRSLRSLQEERLRTTQRAVEVGEQDQLALNAVELEKAVLDRSRLDALARAQRALGELENALQRPLDGGTAPLPLTSQPETTTKEPRP
jgi:cobalt-zinc-cadmium efflux system outer membrane protein